MIDLSRRAFNPELMDAADANPDELAGALRGLAFINQVLGGYGPSKEGVACLWPYDPYPFDPFLAGSFHDRRPDGVVTILDVGCGSGDTLARLHRWAGIDAASGESRLRSRGIELSAESGRMARERLAAAGVTETAIDVVDLFDLDPERDNVDIVHAGLMLHHFPSDAEAARALAHMARLARVGVVVNDLHRHRFAHGAIRALTTVFSRNRMLRHDSALSVRRGFLKSELAALAREAGWDAGGVAIDWRWAFRWLMVYRKPDALIHDA